MNIINAFFGFCILETIIQHYFLSEFKKSKDKEYWNRYVGILIGWFISTVIIYNACGNDERLDLGGALVVMFVCGFSMISNFILLIRGIIIRKKLEMTAIPIINRSCLLLLGIVLIFNTAVFAIIPAKKVEAAKMDTKDIVLEYLNKKYGDCSFSVISVEDDFSYDGIVVKHHIGYEALASTPLIDGNFKVTIRGTDPKSFDGMYDELLTNYYVDDMNGWLQEKYGLECDIYSSLSLDAPDNLGHIPSIDELLEFGDDIDFHIISKKTSRFDFDNDIEGRKNFIKEVTKSIREHYNITKDFSYTFSRWNNAQSFQYDVSVENNKLIIKNNIENYELNLDE